ncbi:MAG: hypothetical protein Q7S11_00220 [bacterium]|nr:hypothetical protein [bacterium]
MNEKELYKSLMTEIIQKQSVILGPQISILKARNVLSIVVSDDGRVTDIKEDSRKALQDLVDEYVKLSGQIVKNALGSIFSRYPQVERIT